MSVEVPKYSGSSNQHLCTYVSPCKNKIGLDDVNILGGSIHMVKEEQKL